MKIIGLLLFSLVFIHGARTQNTKVFDRESQVMTVDVGDTILIQTKHAVIFSKEITDKLDNNRQVYDSLRKSYRKLINENKRLIATLQDAQSRLEQLVSNNDTEAARLERIDDELDNLKEVSEELEETNSDFEQTNLKFSTEIEELKEQNKLLKKQIKRVKWRQWKHYIIAGLTGAAIGIGIVAVSS